MHSLTLIGEIGESDFFTDRISFQDVETALAQLPDDGEPLDVLGMSGGGDWYASAAIRQRLEAEAQRRPLTFHVYGVAASGMAHIVIGTRGARVEMARDAMLKIHGSWSVTAGGSAEHAYEAEATAKINGLMADAIAHRAPSIDRDEMARMLTDRSPSIWFDYTAAEAVEVGLADGILETEDPKIVAQVEEAGAEAPETQTDQGDQAMKVSLPRSTAPMAGTPPETPAQPAAPAAQASEPTEEETRFGRFFASAWKFAAFNRSPAPEPEPAPQAAQITEPAVSPATPAQAALPFAMPQAATPAPAADVVQLAMMQETANTYAAQVTGGMILPPTVQAQAAQLAPLKLEEMKASVNHAMAKASGDAALIAQTQAQLTATTSSRESFETLLRTSADAMSAAAAPLTTRAAAAPVAAPVGEGPAAGSDILAKASAALREMRPQLFNDDGKEAN